MQTVVTENPILAAEILRTGGLVAFPTETVYGLGAKALDETAVKRIFEVKHRPQDNPLIIHIYDLSQINELIEGFPENAQKLCERFMPGPLTVVLNCSKVVPKEVTAGGNTVGIRIPKNETARKFLRAANVPVAAPSANLSGKPSPTTYQAVLEDLDGAIECVLKAEASELGLESTVVDCTTTPFTLLRQGAIPIEELQEVVDEIVTLDEASSGLARSPGLKHKHYSPQAKVRLIDFPHQIPDLPGSAYIGLTMPNVRFSKSYIAADLEDYARCLYEFFRECDRQSIQIIFCQTVPRKGIGATIMDRLARAARGS
ncbi:MAG TPA: L-threonylcarbamoyladenylate synthase [Pyrinomonadaceae bacterium]|nr:L-threonylcarbamoyladenylate synthase [Pyrinomonadaceae bacterium]